MVSIIRLRSQQFVFPQPRFIAFRQKLAMEAHKLSCQLAEKKNLGDLETHLLRKSCTTASVTLADENELALW